VNGTEKTEVRRKRERERADEEYRCIEVEPSESLELTFRLLVAGNSKEQGLARNREMPSKEKLTTGWR
jgi:hypothetical protein